MKVPIRLRVNGEDHALEVEPHRTLADLLRDGLGLTGLNRGCDGGDCGACTVLLSKRPVPSCLVLAADADGADVVTIEGLSGPDGGLTRLQRAFVEKGAIQCGFCTPGMVLTAHALLVSVPRPGEDEIRRALAGNLCRCTGYAKIVEAILEATRG